MSISRFELATFKQGSYTLTITFQLKRYIFILFLFENYGALDTIHDRQMACMHVRQVSHNMYSKQRSCTSLCTLYKWKICLVLNHQSSASVYDNTNSCHLVLLLSSRLLLSSFFGLRHLLRSLGRDIRFEFRQLCLEIFYPILTFK